MLATEVNNVRVNDGVEFDRNGTPIRFQQYTFFIGNHGPFVEKFYAGEQDTPAIVRRINDRVAQLRALGVLPQGQS